MRRTTLILTVVLVMVTLVAASAGTALAIPLAACQGIETAHGAIPPSNVLGETPGHEHVSHECE